MPLPPIDAWQVMSLRVTAFTMAPTPTDGLTWWNDAAGSTPESVASRPRLGQRHEEGDFEGRRLALDIQPERVDWRSGVVIDLEEETLAFAGPFPDVLKSFLKPVMSWLPQCPAIHRVAFGAVLMQPVPDRAAGYNHLAQYLPYVRLDPDSTDFSYSINRPRPPRTAIENLRINRLSKWSVMLIQRFRAVVRVGEIASVAAPIGDHVCRLELDINTTPAPERELPHDRLPALLQELVNLGEEIAANGDTP